MNQVNTVNCQTMPRARYTWDASQCFPFESTWSILQKFMGLNACGARDIQREFGLATKRQHPQNWSDRDRNLHGWGALNPEIVQLSYASPSVGIHSPMPSAQGAAPERLC